MGFVDLLISFTKHIEETHSKSSISLHYLVNIWFTRDTLIRSPCVHEIERYFFNTDLKVLMKSSIPHLVHWECKSFVNRSIYSAVHCNEISTLQKSCCCKHATFSVMYVDSIYFVQCWCSFFSLWVYLTTGDVSVARNHKICMLSTVCYRPIQHGKC